MDNPAADRISDLPVELLIHIMSLLTTKEAVQTGILIKNWRRIWSLVPVIKFDLEEWTDGADPANYEEWKQCVNKFNQFVNCVLENREQSHLDVLQYTTVWHSSCHRRSMFQLIL
jgi:hypothetical protein